MATSWANVDNNFPLIGAIGSEEDIPEQLKALLNYMFTLTEELKYTLNNLDESNINNAALAGFTGGINASVDDVGTRTDTALGQIRQLTGDTGALKEQTEKLSSRITDLSQNLRELNNILANLTLAVRVSGESVSMGGSGAVIELSGTVRVNGREI